MAFFARLSPLRAVNDLRRFLAMRQRYELAFLFLSIVATTLIIAGFIKDSNIARPFKQDIVYVEQWSADRTDAQIKAQQVVDQAAKEKRLAELEAERAKKQAEWTRRDDRLTAAGF